MRGRTVGSLCQMGMSREGIRKGIGSYASMCLSSKRNIHCFAFHNILHRRDDTADMNCNLDSMKWDIAPDRMTIGMAID